MKNIVIVILALIFVLASCNQKSKEQQGTASLDSVYVDTYFTNLFMGDIGGFTGGDGTYSVLLPDGRNVWLFGDTFIGGVNPDNTREKQVPMYVRNSVVLQDGDTLRTLYREIDGVRASFAIPPKRMGNGEMFPEDSVWYWPGDGFIEDGKLKIFLSEFAQLDTGMWGFDWRGTWVASYALPGLKEEGIIKIADSRETNIHFGHAVHVDDAYTYVYGAGEGKPHVARYLNGAVTNGWTYFNGTEWSNDPAKAQPMVNMEGSEQFSVFQYSGIYILVTQMGMLSNDICSFTSATPYGPWENKKLLYTTPLPDSTIKLFTYNALAHPQFTEDGMLLISYNTNSMELEDHFRDASIYRPRFIRVPLKMIDDSLKQQKE